MILVMDQIMNDKHGQQPEKIKQFARNIDVPTLILWGADDKVSVL